MQAKDYHYMSHALKLAEKGLYSTDPNPRVGCVVVKEGMVVGQGWHVKAGLPHAEILALRDAGEAARGASVYVNLEPCCHQGRTPPCTGFLIDAGVKRVVAAMEDPNPQVAGGGVQNLRSVGIDVDVGVLRQAAEKLNRGFVQRIKKGRPWVTVKVAASMDGRTATSSGESKWISNEQSRKDVHHWRARSSVVLTGSGTVLADNPALTVRHIETERQPLRVIVDSNFSTPPDAKVVSGPGRVLVATARADHVYPEDIDLERVEVVYVPNADNTVDLVALMDHLSQREINEVFVEAGPTLSSAMIRAGLVDEVLVYLAPSLLGSKGRGMFDLNGLDSLADRLQLDMIDIRQFGDNLRITLKPPEHP